MSRTPPRSRPTAEPPAAPLPAKPSVAPVPAEPSPNGTLLPALAGLLLAARYLQPTEGAFQGETLWQAQLWLLGATVWGWHAWRTGALRLRVGLLDALLALLVIGHALSTVPVLWQGGEARAAVNLVWEWVGLAAALFLVRQLCEPERLRQPLAIFAASTVALAALGVWQHHVTFPQQAARYDALRLEEDRLTAEVIAGSVAAQARLREVEQQFSQMNRPVDPAGRSRFEDRLRYSVEPYGLFALTNTFGGLLAAAVPVLVGFAWSQRARGTVVALAAGVALVLYCLVLTKSRTAWVGLAAGTMTGVALMLFQRRTARPTKLIAASIAGVLVAVGIAIGVAVLAGGLDAAVISEAPKSLQYRLQYWHGALAVLAERPLLGTGPGNFRTFYLEHRPAGASEAVAAPHNLLLDVWTAGGLLSLVVLLGLLAITVAWLLGWRSATDRQPPQTTVAAGHTKTDTAKTGTPETAAGGTACAWGAVAAFGVVFVLGWLGGYGFDWRLPAIAPLAAGFLFLLLRSRCNLNRTAIGAAWVALSVHLLGADGIEFPAVMQTVLLLTAAVAPPPPLELGRRGVAAVAVAFSLLTLGCLLTGLAPVLNAAALTARAEAAIQRGEPAADRLLLEAAAADRLSVEPLRLRAELATAQAVAAPSQTSVAVARRRWQELLQLRPRDLSARERLADLEMLWFRSSGDLAAAVVAADALQQAVALSPTEARLHAEAATALAAAGRVHQAADAATAALRLDDLNRAAGHTDLIFNAELRERLDQLAGVGSPAAEP